MTVIVPRREDRGAGTCDRSIRFLTVEQTDLTSLDYGLNIACSVKHSHRLTWTSGCRGRSSFPYISLTNDFGGRDMLTQSFDSSALAVLCNIYCLEQYKFCYGDECTDWSDATEYRGYKQYRILSPKPASPTEWLPEEAGSHAPLVCAASL